MPSLVGSEMCIRDRNRRRHSAPNLDCDSCGSSAGCGLLCHTYGTSAPWPTTFFLGAPLSAPDLHCGLHAVPCLIGFNVSRRDSCLAFFARPPASQSVLHCCTLQVRLTPSRGLICCNLQQRPNSSAKLLQQSSDNYRDICSLCQTIWTRGLPARDSSSITGLALDKSCLLYTSPSPRD